MFGKSYKSKYIIIIILTINKIKNNSPNLFLSNYTFN